MLFSRLQPHSRAGAVAHLLALFVSTAFLLTTHGFQHIGGLHPCETCIWQRWSYGVAAGAALAALALRPDALRRAAVALAGTAILASGVIGAYQTGVEQKWRQRATACTNQHRASTNEDIVAIITNAPLVSCDNVPREFLGFSLAAMNAIAAFATGLIILLLLLRSRHATGAMPGNANHP